MVPREPRRDPTCNRRAAREVTPPEEQVPGEGPVPSPGSRNLAGLWAIFFAPPSHIRSHQRPPPVIHGPREALLQKRVHMGREGFHKAPLQPHSRATPGLRKGVRPFADHRGANQARLRPLGGGCRRCFSVGGHGRVCSGVGGCSWGCSGLGGSSGGVIANHTEVEATTAFRGRKLSGHGGWNGEAAHRTALQKSGLRRPQPFVR